MEEENIENKSKKIIAASQRSNPESVSYDKKLKKHWDKYNLDYMKKYNRDRVIVVDGTEGVGKSLWTIQQAYYLDKNMFSSPEEMCRHIVFTPDEFLNAVKTFKNSVIIFDEAFRGMSSRASLSKINRSLVQALMEMRQNNNIVFIVLPSFFLLDIYPAMLRSNTLFNIYFVPTVRKRAWRGFNKADKNAIYQQGLKKGWVYTRSTTFKGYFYNKFPRGKEYEKAYLKKKEDTFRDTTIVEKKDSREQVYEKRREIIAGIGISILYLAFGSSRKVSKLYNYYNFNLEQKRVLYYYNLVKDSLPPDAELKAKEWLAAGMKGKLGEIVKKLKLDAL